MGVLDDWVESGFTEVYLPSGRWIRWREPDAAQLVQQNLLPKQLRLAILAGGKAQAKEEMADKTADALSELTEARDRMVAASIRAVRRSSSEPWEAVTLTPEQLTSLPPDDLDALRRIINGMPADEVTVRVRRWRKELTDEEAAVMIDALTERRVDSWLSFRPIRRSPAAGVAVEDVGEPAVKPARTARPRRARAG